MKAKDDVLDYLRNRTRPSCSVPGAVNGHIKVTCGSCVVTIPDDDVLTTTTANEVERRLEPCLGRNWMP